MNLDLERDFENKIDSLKNKTVLLHFSTGADSVASYLKLKEHDISPILIYHYFLKDLPLHKNYISYFEQKFNEHIFQFPSTLYSERIGNALYQIPIRGRAKFVNSISHYELRKHSKDGFDKLIDETLGGNVVFHLGLRYSDGLRRFQHLSKNGCSFQNKFYPVSSFAVSDIQHILEKNDCYLPPEYAYWGISWEAPRAWNVGLLKTHFPESYRQLTRVFPMIMAENFRKYAKLNKHFRQRITQLGKYSMPKGDLIW